ncbi:MAG: hypothetical protein AAF492_02865, partial [Verrucomicrobiota bacterium]
SLGTVNIHHPTTYNTHGHHSDPFSTNGTLTVIPAVEAPLIRLTRIAYDPTHELISFDWTSRPSHQYSVWFSDDLVDWQIVQAAVPASAGTSTTFGITNNHVERGYIRISLD